MIKVRYRVDETRLHIFSFTMTSNSESVLIGNFLEHLQFERCLSKYTSRNYKHAINTFFQWLRRREKWSGRLDSITRNHIRGFVIEFQNTHSRRTLHNWCSGIKAFFNYLIKHKQIDSNPWATVSLPKLNKPLPIFLTEAQIVKLLSGPVILLTEKVMDPFLAWRDRLILELLYGGGLRVSELVGLNYGSIDWSNGVATVMGKGSKERKCPLGTVALECLKKFRDEFAPDISRDAPILLNKQKTRLPIRQVQHILKKYLALANLPPDLTPHKIRHSYATHLLNHGANLRIVQELLGHVSLSTTQIYTHIDFQRLKEVHKLSHPRN